jgi:predicted nucleic acid-binding protein
MPVEPGLVDANVLAYASNADDPKYAASRALLEEARAPLTTLYITPQIISEFYSVITNPRRVAAPSSPAVALHTLFPRFWRYPAYPFSRSTPAP